MMDETPLAYWSRETDWYMTFALQITRAVAFFGVLAIIALSLVPGTDRPHTGLPGEAEHFIAYCATGSAFALGFWSRASGITVALGLTLLAGSMEIMQLWVPGRHSAILDAVASSMGGLSGIALGGLLVGLAAQAYRKHRLLSESAETLQ
jgi:VanZ family protein